MFGIMLAVVWRFTEYLVIPAAVVVVATSCASRAVGWRPPVLALRQHIHGTAPLWGAARTVKR